VQNLDSKVSITFDGWTAVVMVCYIAVTAHWINEDWELERSLLAFDQLRGSHSGENLADELYTLLKEYGLKSKVRNFASLSTLYSVTDQTSAAERCRRQLADQQ
jgi:hypothetical protein